MSELSPIHALIVLFIAFWIFVGWLVWRSWRGPSSTADSTDFTASIKNGKRRIVGMPRQPHCYCTLLSLIWKNFQP
jgi:hypothetical protein